MGQRMFREDQEIAVEEVSLDPVESAKAAGLRYVTDAMPGIRRRKVRDGFAYVDARGSEVTDPDERLRIKALAIPPAWTDVWICASPRGHLQATGRDARGRKQYRYHTRWRQVRDEAKYDRLLAFGLVLPAIRRQTDEDLTGPGLPRRKVLAALVQLLERTLVRVGNDEYARDNDSYGLTTMQDDNASINGSEVRFTFRGKSGKNHSIGLRDRRLARIVKQCRDIPGQRLFQYVDAAGDHHSVYSEDVNGYLREIAGQEFTAKDFRTWSGSVLAAEALREIGPFESKAEAKRNVTRAIEAASERLGNTPAICRKCYVHPAVIESYLAGDLDEQLADAPAVEGLSPHEAALLKLLRLRAEQNGK
jgi:DNA topoisomerase-1